MSLIVLIAALAAAAPPPTAAELPDVPYSWELSMLAQRYYGQCRAEAKLRERLVRDFNEHHLTEPPFRSFRNGLSPANRRDADLVCLGAALEHLDEGDGESVTHPANRPARSIRP